MIYLPWLLLLLLVPYWLGPIVVWLTQKAGARPVFEPFTPGRHSVPEDVAAAFRQTCDALTTEGFHVVADLFQTGQMRHVSTRVALLENSGTDELALAVAMFTAARPARLVTSYAELPTKFRDGRSVSVHNSPIPGSFTPPPSKSSCGCRSCATRRGCAASSGRISSDTIPAASARRSSIRTIRPDSWRVPWCAS